MALTKAREFKTRFGASSLHLQTCEDLEQRKIRSAECKNSLLGVLGGSALSDVEKRDLTTFLVDDPRRQWWNPEDLSALVDTIERSACRRRRTTQDFTSHMLEFFLQSEWLRWKAQGAAGAETIAVELVQRLKAIGGKNLCEYTKKKAVAIWLFCRGDWEALGAAGRDVALHQFKERLSRNVRLYEPSTYLEELPSIDRYRVQHADMFARAFPTEQPQPIDSADASTVMYIDGLFKCRGGASWAQHMVQPTAQVALQQLQSFPQPALQQFGGISPQIVQLLQGLASVGAQGQGHGDILPGLQYLQHPRGRPMRSVSIANGAIHAPWAPSPPLPPNPPLPLPAPLPAAPTPAPHAAAHVVVADSDGAANAAADLRDEVAAVTEKMMNRGKAADGGKDGGKGGRKETGGGKDDDDSEEDDTDDNESQSSGKPKGKHTPKKKPSGKPKGKPKAASAFVTPVKATKKKKATAATAAKLTAWPRKPSIGWEVSRAQCMCRSGKGGTGSSKRISFEEAGGPKKAWKEAKRWLKATIEEYEDFIAQ